jgi:hypothetical protein
MGQCHVDRQRETLGLLVGVTVSLLVIVEFYVASTTWQFIDTRGL